MMPGTHFLSLNFGMIFPNISCSRKRPTLVLASTAVCQRAYVKTQDIGVSPAKEITLFRSCQIIGNSKAIMCLCVIGVNCQRRLSFYSELHKLRLSIDEISGVDG